MDLINSIETFEARVPLPAPLAVGSARITHRTYSVVKITTSDGIVGVGYCYSRGLPMAKIIDDVMTPVAIGQTAESPEEIRKLILGFNWQSAEHGSVTSAASAVDIALHDIAGKRAGKSVAAMLGATVSEVPIYSVIGYHYGKDESGLREEIDYALSRGINSFKIVMGADTPERDANRLKVLREKVGDKPLIALDAFRTLKTLDNAIKRVNLIKEYGVAFVEDPFLESEGVAAIALREATGVPVSFGESLASSKMAEQVLYYNPDDFALDVANFDLRNVAFPFPENNGYLGSEKIKETIGFVSKHNLESMLEIYFKWWLEKGDLEPKEYPLEQRILEKLNK